MSGKITVKCDTTGCVNYVPLGKVWCAKCKQEEE